METFSKKVYEFCSFRKEQVESILKPTIIDKNQFKHNISCNFISGRYTYVVGMLKQHIDFYENKTNVCKYLKSFSYETTQGWKNKAKIDTAFVRFNPIDSEEVVLSKKMLDNFTVDLLNFHIERLKNKLLTESIVFNSTDKLSNLCCEIELECTQQIIRELSTLLSEHNK